MWPGWNKDRSASFKSMPSTEPCALDEVEQTQNAKCLLHRQFPGKASVLGPEGPLGTNSCSYRSHRSLSESFLIPGNGLTLIRLRPHLLTPYTPHEANSHISHLDSMSMSQTFPRLLNCILPVTKSGKSSEWNTSRKDVHLYCQSIIT